MVFEPLFTTRPGGMGMDLRICRSIIEAHGGAITVGARSTGQGALFCFALPCLSMSNHDAAVRTA